MHQTFTITILLFAVLDGSLIGLIAGGTMLLLIIVMVTILIVRCKLKSKQTQNIEQQNAIYGTGTFFAFEKVKCVKNIETIKKLFRGNK